MRIDGTIPGCPVCGGTRIFEVTRFVVHRSRRVSSFNEDGGVICRMGDETWEEPPYEELGRHLKMLAPEVADSGEVRAAYYVCEDCSAEFDDPAHCAPSGPPNRVRALQALWGLSDEEMARALGMEAADLPTGFIFELPVEASRRLGHLKEASRLMAGQVPSERIPEVVRRPARAAGGGRSLLDLATDGETERLTMVVVDLFDLRRFMP